MTDKRLNIPTSVAQIVLQFIQAGQLCENVLYAQKEHTDDDWATSSHPAFDSGAADTVAGDIATWATGQWSPFSNDQASMLGVQIIWNTVLTTGPLSGKDYSGSPYPVAGANTGEALPNVCTKAVSIRTGVLGRHYHGRVYHVGLCDAHIDPSVDANVLRSTAVDDLNTLWEALRTALHANHGLSGPIYDRFNIGVMALTEVPSPGAAPVNLVPAIFTQATQFSVRDQNVDTMRRRLPGHNRHH